MFVVRIVRCLNELKAVRCLFSELLSVWMSWEI